MAEVEIKKINDGGDKVRKQRSKKSPFKGDEFLFQNNRNLTKKQRGKRKEYPCRD